MVITLLPSLCSSFLKKKGDDHSEWVTALRCPQATASSRYFLHSRDCSGFMGYSLDLKGFAPGFSSMCMSNPGRLTAPCLNMASLKTVGNSLCNWARKLSSTILTVMVATDKLSLLGKDIHRSAQFIWGWLFFNQSYSSPKRLYGNQR